MALGFSIRYALLLLVTFNAGNVFLKFNLPEHILCRDKDCNQTICKGQTTQIYNAPSEFHISFPSNQEVDVYALSEDKELLHIKVANKRGYAPASLIKITNQFVKTDTLIKVKAQLKQSGLGTASSEFTGSDAPDKTLLPDVTATQSLPTGADDRSCIIDNTSMFGAMCDDSDATPLGATSLPSTGEHAPSIASSWAGEHTTVPTLLGQDAPTENVASLFSKELASTPASLASLAQHKSAMPPFFKSSNFETPPPRGGVEPLVSKPEEKVQRADEGVSELQTMPDAPQSKKLHGESSSAKSETEGQTDKELSEQPKFEELLDTPREQKTGTDVKPTEDSKAQLLSEHSQQKPDDADEKEIVTNKPIPGEEEEDEEEDEAEVEDEDDVTSGEGLAAEIIPSSIEATRQRATEPKTTSASADAATYNTGLPESGLKANLSEAISQDATQPSSPPGLQGDLQVGLEANLSEILPQDATQPLQGDLQSADSINVTQQGLAPVLSGSLEPSLDSHQERDVLHGSLSQATSVLPKTGLVTKQSMSATEEQQFHLGAPSLGPSVAKQSTDFSQETSMLVQNAIAMSQGTYSDNGTLEETAELSPSRSSVSSTLEPSGNIPNNASFRSVPLPLASQLTSLENVRNLEEAPNLAEMGMANAANSPAASGFNALAQEGVGSEFGRADNVPALDTVAIPASSVSLEVPPQKPAAGDAVEQTKRANIPMSSPEVDSPVEMSAQSEEPLSMLPQKRVLLQQPGKTSQVPPFGLGDPSRTVASEPVETSAPEASASTLAEETLPNAAVMNDDVPPQSTVVSETASLEAVLSPSVTVQPEIPLQSVTVEQDGLLQSTATEEVVSSMLDRKPLEDALHTFTGETLDTSSDQVPAMDLYWNMAREYLFWLLSLVPEPLQAALGGLVLGMAPPAALTVVVMCGVLGCALLVLRACYLQRRKENALTGTISSLEQKLFTLLTEREVLTEQLEKARSQVERSRRELFEQEQQAKCLQEEKQELQSCQRDRDQVLRDLRTSLAERNEQLDVTKLLLAEKERQVSELESEASWHQQNEASLEEQLRGAKEEVLRLEEISEEAQTREKEAQSRLVEATQTGDRLWKELESLRKREQALCLQVDKSSEEVSHMTENLAEKDTKIKALLSTMEQLQILQEHWQTQEELVNVSSRLKRLMDIAQIQYECKIAREQQSTLESRLEAQAKELEASRAEADSLRQEMAASRAEQEAALHQRQEAMTKLEVLSSYFKDRELHLQREIGRQEVEHLQKEADVSTAAQRLVLLEQQSASYQSQLASLKREMDISERNYKTQVADQEKRAHENWLAARAAERKLEEAHKETASLRQRLTLLEREQQMQPQFARTTHQGFPPGGPLVDAIPDGLPPMPPLPMGVPLPPPPLGMPPHGGPPLPPLMDMMRPPPFPPEVFKRMRHSPYREGEGLPLPPWASPPPLPQLFEPRPTRGSRMGPPSPGSSDSRSNTHRSSPHSSLSEPRRNGMGNSNV